MRFKDLKLGLKLGIGFGGLILISMILGSIAVINMSRITTESEYLANEYVPEVKIATDLRGAANRAMYEMRGYGYTEEVRFYEGAQKEIGLIYEAIKEGENLDKNADRLVKLGEQLEVAKSAIDKYNNLVVQTNDVNTVLAQARNRMDAGAGVYMQSCNDYLENQNNSMAREIRSGGTSNSRLTKITLINNVIDVGNEVRIGNFKSQAQRDPQIFNDALAKFPQVHELLDEVMTYTRVEADIVALKEIGKGATEYENAMDDFIQNWLKREELASQRNDAGRELIQACAKTTEAGLSGTQNIADDAIHLLGTSSKTMVVGLIFAMLIGILFAFYLTRMITRPINMGVIFAKQLSQGDLTATIEVEQKDEIGQLAYALTRMGERLRDIVEDIRSGAENIASASQQMSGTSQEMSQGANEQASSVEEVSSSMEEMAANIQNNTDNAKQTEQIAITSASGVKEGSEATNMAVEGMKNIAEKIKIINDIAFQTNILALNAAVEAARAGEHGKGFAVVAAEVRKLAERSKLSADEIDELSKNGVEVAEKAGNKLEEIVPDIEKTAQLVQEISSASFEQNSGAEQVNNAMEQLNNVTQQNAAASEEMATSSEELASQADQLKTVISFFRTGKDSGVKSGAPVKPLTSNAQKSARDEKERLILDMGTPASDSGDDEYEGF